MSIGEMLLYTFGTAFATFFVLLIIRAFGVEAKTSGEADNKIRKKQDKMFFVMPAMFIIGGVITFYVIWNIEWSNSAGFRYLQLYIEGVVSESFITQREWFISSARQNARTSGFFAIFFYIIFFFLFYVIKEAPKWNKETKDATVYKEQLHKSYLDLKKLRPTAEHRCYNHRFIIDANSNRLCLVCEDNNAVAHTGALDASKYTFLTFGDVIGCEIHEDSAVVGGIGRAIAGGILAGGVGAIVGAVTAKKHVMSYKVVVYTNDVNKPQIILPLINTKVSKSDAEYNYAAEFANNVNASIKAIMAKNESNLNNLSADTITPQANCS